MALTIEGVAITVSDVEQAKVFWTAALNYGVRHADPTFAVLTTRTGVAWMSFCNCGRSPNTAETACISTFFPTIKKEKFNGSKLWVRSDWLGIILLMPITLSWPTSTATNSVSLLQLPPMK